jgi:hypothetical protein
MKLHSEICIICTGHWRLVGGKLKDSGTDGTRETQTRNLKCTNF